jgi:hypothetical protein
MANQDTPTPPITDELSPYLDEREQQINDDYDWAMWDESVRRAYGGQVVAVSGRKVWGAGSNHEEALANARAQSDCPPRLRIALVVVPEL